MSEPSSGALAPIPAPHLDDLEPAVQQQLIEARATFETLFAHPANDGATLAGAYGLLAQHYHAYDLRDTARGCYQRAALHGPQDGRWPYLLADLARRDGHAEAAAELYRAAMLLAPDDIPTLIHLAEVSTELGAGEQAQALLNRALELDPRCDAARAQLGQLALSRGEYKRAIESLRGVLERVPQADRLHYPLGMAYRAVGDLDAAREHLDRVGQVGLTVVDPLLDGVQALASGERVFLLRGRAAFAAGRYAEAVEAFRGAVQADPQSSRARINLATALGQAGQRDAAIEQCRLALALAPDNVTAHFNLGALLAGQGRDQEAEQQLLAVLALAPRDGAAHRELAHLLRRSARPEAALSHYAEAVRLSPDDAVARLAEAELLVNGQRYGDALVRLEVGHAALPLSGQLAAALAKLLAASPRVDLRDGERALDLALRVHASTRQAGHAELVALALAELGRCDEAAQWMREAAGGAVDDTQRARRNRAAVRYEAGPPCGG